jgi:site-specific DNA-cytosine methylase
MNVLDLYAGLQGWSSEFKARGHRVVSLDIDPRFDCTITADVLELDLHRLDDYGPFDIVLAGPPCEAFSVAALSRNWEVIGGNTSKPIVQPRSEGAVLGERLVARTLEIVEHVRPKAWVMENPTAMMRRLSILQDIERRSVTYCKYGMTYRKPTDLWGKFPDGLVLHEPCKTAKNLNYPLAGQLVNYQDKTFVTDRDGIPCHESAPRGSRTGVQGIKSVAVRAVVPPELSRAICISMEHQLA